jgi:hypothetical protein
MRAKTINEFQQGQDPYKTMGLGSKRTPKNGDNFIFNISVIWEQDEWIVSNNPVDIGFDKGQKAKVYKENQDFYNTYGISCVTSDGDIEDMYDTFFISYNDFKKYCECI